MKDKEKPLVIEVRKRLPPGAWFVSPVAWEVQWDLYEKKLKQQEVQPDEPQIISNKEGEQT